jgi:hypothetical protein
MINDDKCSGCVQKHDCKSIYKTIGNSRGPNVTFKALCAFVFPVLVFILILMATEAVFSKTGLSGPLQIIVSFILALAASLLTAWLAGIPQRRQTCPPDSCESKEAKHEN